MLAARSRTHRVALCVAILLLAPACSGRVTKLENLGTRPTPSSGSPAPSISIYPVPSPTPPRTPKVPPYTPSVPPSPLPTSPPPSPSPSPQTPGLRTFTLKAHEKATAQFTVSKGSPSATFTTTLAGQGKFKATLVTPAGDVISSSSPGKVFRARQTNSDAYLIGHPGKGLWQVKVVVTSAPAPLTVSVRFAQSPADNAVPIARSSETLKKRVVTLDAGASTDKDGTIGAYFWDLGDGTVVSGAQITHEYPATGTYSINLVVQDNQTGLGFLTLDPITITK